MTQKERIIQYILHTPCNNNRQILESLLLNLETGEYYFDLIKDEGAWEDKSYLKYSAVYDENGNIYIAITDVSAGTPLSDQSHWVAIMKDAGSIQSDWNQNDETKKDYIKNRPFYEGTSVENLGTTFEGWRASCQSHGEDSVVINANVAGIDYQDVKGLVQTDTNGRYVHYYFGENRDYRIEVDRGMAQVTIRPAGTEYYFYKVSSTVKQIDPKYLPFEQADWNQNDDTKKDYVKGRTHWAEIKPVVEKVNIITDASYKYESQGFYKINGSNVCTYPQNIELTEGTPITITIETKSFAGRLSAANETQNPLQFSLKNQQVNGYNVPSAWYFFPESHRIEIYGGGSSGDPAMSFSITAEIEQEREVVHTLDPKYIKDMYYTETNLKELLCEFTTDGSSPLKITMPEQLEPDTVYIWTFNEETGKSLCKRSVSGTYVTAYIEIADYGLITENFSTTTPDNYITSYNPGTSQLPGHITISKEKPDVVHQIDPKYIPNQNTVFEARLFPDSSIPNKLNLESGITVSDLIRAFDEGRQVIARVCADEDDDGTLFEMQRYYVNASSGIPYRIIFAPCSISGGLRSGGAINSLSTMVIEFIEGNWYFSGFDLDAIGGRPGFAYTIPFEINAASCNTFAELVSATQNFRWRAYIYEGDHKLYLQIPEYTSSVTPNILYFTGITEPDGSGISSCVWTTVRIPVSSSNVILWDDSTLAASNTALDTWDYYKLNKDQSGVLHVYDVFNEKITNLGLVGKGVIEYGDYRYLFNCIAGSSLLFGCMDLTNSSVPKISTISINRRTNTIGVTDFHPIWEIATESEVNNVVDNIFETI